MDRKRNSRSVLQGRRWLRGTLFYVLIAVGLAVSGFLLAWNAPMAAFGGVDTAGEMQAAGQAEGITPYDLGTQVPINVGSVTDGTYTGYTVSGGVITLTGDYDYILTGTTTANRVVIGTAATQVTFRDLSITNTAAASSPVQVEGGTGAADLTILLAGTSGSMLMTGVEYYPALCLDGGRNVTIQNGNTSGAEGELTAQTDSLAYTGAIGNVGAANSNLASPFEAHLTMAGGTVNATATGTSATAGTNASAAAIGAGRYSAFTGSITISGGTVKANGGATAAAIGCAQGAMSGDISITGGTVSASTIGTNSVAIGSYSPLSGTISITGGTVTTTTGTSGNAGGIGCANSAFTGRIQISGSGTQVKAAGRGSFPTIGGGPMTDGEITITDGAAVEVTAGGSAAAIGTGQSRAMNNSRIQITDSNVAITRSSDSGGIGTGTYGDMISSEILIDGTSVLTYNTHMSNSGALIGSGIGGMVDADSTITIADDAQVTSPRSTAGIGSGVGGEMAGSIIIKGNAQIDVRVYGNGAAIGSGGLYVSGNTRSLGHFTGSIAILESAEVTAVSSNSNNAGTAAGAAIGSGGNDLAYSNNEYLIFSGSITINTTGLVTAKSATFVFMNDGRAAGIGTGVSGHMTGEAEILIQDTTVEASSEYAAGIGVGMYGIFEGSITIDGGDVTAQGGLYGPGIGSMYSYEKPEEETKPGGATRSPISPAAAEFDPDDYDGVIEITGGTVTATGGEYGGAGIGYGTPYMIDGTSYVPDTSLGIFISGGDVTATGGGTEQYGGIAGAGIGTGYSDEDNPYLAQPIAVEITGGTVTATGGGIQVTDSGGVTSTVNAAGIGYGAGLSTGAGGGVLLAFTTGADTRAYAMQKAINVQKVSGGGQYVNACFTDGTAGVRNIQVSQGGSSYTTLDLPADYAAFAYTLKDVSASTATTLVTSGDNIVNGDAANPWDPAGYGPHNAAYGTKDITTAAGTTTLWPVRLEPDSFTVTVQYVDATYTLLPSSLQPTPSTYTILDGGTVDIPIVALAGYDLLGYRIGTNPDVPVSVPTTLTHTVTGNVTIQIIYEEESTVLALEIPVQLLWAAFSSDNGTITSLDYSITNHSSKAIDVTLTDFEVVNHAGVNLVQSSALDGTNDEYYLGLKGTGGAFGGVSIPFLPNGSVVSGGYLGRLDAEGGSSSAGTFTFEGQYAGSFEEVRQPEFKATFKFAVIP